MILRETPEFFIESDVDDEQALAVADALVDVFSKYSWDESEHSQPVGITANGILFVVRYKEMNA